MVGRIVGVHGIMQEQFGRSQLQRAWEPALRDGLEIAAGGAAPDVQFDLAFYADLFLRPEQQGDPFVKGTAAPTALSAHESADQSEVAFLESAVDETVADLPLLGPEKGITTVSSWLRPFARTLTRHFDGRSVMPFLELLHQVHTYQTEDDLAEQIRARVRATIGTGCDVLIGHSMGTLVAFETLVLEPELAVDTLITLGAPLSMKTVVRAIRGPAGPAGPGGPPGPTQLRRWVNVFDPHDPVAGAGRADRLWPAAEDFGVDNGDLPHAIGHYLSKRITGQVIIDATARRAL